jgi:hypothetical protein
LRSEDEEAPSGYVDVVAHDRDIAGVLRELAHASGELRLHGIRYIEDV